MTISRMLLDPRDARRVLVAAVGHPFGPNPDRGVFLTSDGGQTWRKSLYIDATHGASDIDLDPSNPDVVFAGMWRFDRKPWRYDSGDTSGGLFKSTNGGQTWKKMTHGFAATDGAHRREGRAQQSEPGLRDCGNPRRHPVPLAGRRRELRSRLQGQVPGFARILLLRPARRSAR